VAIILRRCGKEHSFFHHPLPGFGVSLKEILNNDGGWVPCTLVFSKIPPFLPEKST